MFFTNHLKWYIVAGSLIISASGADEKSTIEKFPNESYWPQKVHLLKPTSVCGSIGSGSVTLTLPIQSEVLAYVSSDKKTLDIYTKGDHSLKGTIPIQDTDFIAIAIVNQKESQLASMEKEKKRLEELAMQESLKPPREADWVDGISLLGFYLGMNKEDLLKKLEKIYYNEITLSKYIEDNKNNDLKPSIMLANNGKLVIDAKILSIIINTDNHVAFINIMPDFFKYNKVTYKELGLEHLYLSSMSQYLDPNTLEPLEFVRAMVPAMNIPEMECIPPHYDLPLPTYFGHVGEKATYWKYISPQGNKYTISTYKSINMSR